MTNQKSNGAGLIEVAKKTKRGEEITTISRHLEGNSNYEMEKGLDHQCSQRARQEMDKLNKQTGPKEQCV